MGIIERQQRDKEKLKNKILSAAAEIITESGYEYLKIRALAERIEYSPRTVYLYFSDKAALLNAVIEKGFQYTVEKQKKLEISPSITPEEKLEIMIGNHIMMAYSDPNFYRAVVLMTMNKDFRPGPNQSQVILNVRDLLNEYIENESIKQMK